MANDKNADKPLDPAKVENEQNRRKVKHENDQAQWESPEHLRKSGGDVFPEKQVVPNQPDPSNADEYKNTRYDGNGGKGE